MYETLQQGDIVSYGHYHNAVYLGVVAENTVELELQDSKRVKVNESVFRLYVTKHN